ncbi:MAG: hypothetical protein H0U92_12050 [Actinobacteria bacterium]|nr:hypothetical protein [Actinomycetota bacterium]
MLALIRRPDLWWAAARQGFVLLRPGRRARGYLHFRLVTQYGGDGCRPTGDDFVQYIEWCRAERRRR